MSTLVLGTNVVSMDEGCFSLKEILQPAADSKGVRRVQCIRVIRQDRVAEFQRDMGPANTFTAGEFVIPGGVSDERTGRIYIEHTIGELMDIADLLRSDQYDRPEPPQVTDLVGAYRDLPDKRRRQRKALSQFGPVARIQRS